MKKYLIALTAIVVLLFATVFILPINYKKNTGSKNAKQVSEKSIESKSDCKTACCTEESADSYSGNSIYQLKCTWKDQNGNETKLEKFNGKKVVLAMLYTNCTTACPVIVNDMQRLEAALPKNQSKDYQFVLVSIDPQRDDPVQLKKYSGEKNLDKNWTLLCGNENSVAQLAQTIGFRYKKNQNGMFTHSNLITFLNERGEIENQSEGLNQDAKKLLTMTNNF